MDRTTFQEMRNGFPIVFAEIRGQIFQNGIPGIQSQSSASDIDKAGKLKGICYQTQKSLLFPYGIRYIRPRKADSAQPWLHDGKSYIFGPHISPVIRHGISEGKGTRFLQPLQQGPGIHHLFIPFPILRNHVVFKHPFHPLGIVSLPGRYAARILIPCQYCVAVTGEINV